MSHLPYPGKYESHDSWMRRCDEWERRRKELDDDRYNSAPDGRGLSEKQRAKLTKAEAKLPPGWYYWVCNDNRQLGLRSDYSFDGDLALATKHKNNISGQVYAEGPDGAKLALLLNRATAAVWGRQIVWANWDAQKKEVVSMWTPEEWLEAQEQVKKMTRKGEQVK